METSKEKKIDKFPALMNSIIIFSQYKTNVTDKFNSKHFENKNSILLTLATVTRKGLYSISNCVEIF
jgi:hypothetical protein